MRLLLAVLALLLLLEPAQTQTRKAKTPPPPQLTSPEHILKWVNSYRQKPQPEHVPDAVRRMSELGLFKEQDSAGVYVGFIAGVIGDNQLEAEKLVGRMFPMPPEDQVSLIKAIAYSGLPDWKDLLKKFVERMPARKVLIERYLDDKMPTLANLPLDSSPAALDAQWGFYFATGSFVPVQRIIGSLAWSKDPNDVEKLTIGSMAKWTLANNASRDVDLLRLCKSELAHQPKAVIEPLKEVIEAAETFELSRIRKDAMASIDELKRKGPEKYRNMSWWAQAGTTVLALGCVAASAAGQIQFGLPCIIGGPLSQAAARYLIPQQ